MFNDEMLELELGLLIVKYGSARVIKSLAKMEKVSDEELVARFQALKNAPKKQTPKTRKRAIDSIEKIIKTSPENADILNELFARFQDKSFLPSLHEIRKFLDRHTGNPKRPKSRESSAANIWAVLVQMDRKSLQNLIQDHTQNSALGIISDEIMKNA